MAACKGAECRGLAPLARRHALVSTEARSACPVDIPKWSAWQDLHLQPFRLERNASALGYTRWCPRPDLHRHFARFKCAVSALDYVGCWRSATKWYRVKDLHPQPPRSERGASAGWANAAKIVNRKSQIVNEIGTPGRTGFPSPANQLPNQERSLREMQSRLQLPTFEASRSGN